MRQEILLGSCPCISIDRTLRCGRRHKAAMLRLEQECEVSISALIKTFKLYLAWSGHRPRSNLDSVHAMGCVVLYRDLKLIARLPNPFTTSTWGEASRQGSLRVSQSQRPGQFSSEQKIFPAG